MIKWLFRKEWARLEKQRRSLGEMQADILAESAELAEETRKGNQDATKVADWFLEHEMRVYLFEQSCGEGGKFEILRSNNKEYYFHLVSTNGRIIAHSEGYSSKQAAITGINAIKKLAVNADIIDISGDRKR
jgi:uncharacterized protein YegP (UPF0339 family)